MPDQKPKTIYEYSNYREFIRDYYLSSKNRNKTFSYRVFSRLAGFKSANFIKLVIDGKSKISGESAAQLASAMKLNNEETAFFKNLVSFNQAATSEERAHFAELLMKSRSYRKYHPLHQSQYQYFSEWYYVALRGLVGLSGFKEDYDWISRHLHPPISPAEVKKAFEELQKLGLVKRNEQGKLVQAESDLTTADEVTAASVAKYHKEMLRRASESIDRVPREKREITAACMGISLETAKKIKEMIQRFRKEVAEVASQDRHGEAIYQFNLQLFPILELMEEKAEKK